MAGKTALRGASAESLAGLTQSLNSAVDAGADAGQLAEDLFGISALLSSEPALRRAVTDPSLPGAAKSELAKAVLGGKAAEQAVAITAEAAGSRWTSPRDLADALEELGVIALVQGAERSGDADALEADLFGIDRLLAENPQLRDALADPARSAADKENLLAGLLQGKVTPAGLALAKQAIRGSHRTVAVALDTFQKLAASHRQRLIGLVRVARPLADGDVERLRTALSRQYDRPVHLNVLVDPSVIGGIKVEIGDDVIDGTVSARLDDARRRLAG